MTQVTDWVTTIGDTVADIPHVLVDDTVAHAQTRQLFNDTQTALPTGGIQLRNPLARKVLVGNETASRIQAILQKFSGPIKRASVERVSFRAIVEGVFPSFNNLQSRLHTGAPQ